MIAKLTGLIDEVGADRLILDVGGVGYLVHCSGRTLARFGPSPKGPVSLLIDTHLREDRIALYGFADAVERDWFRLLTTVQGVGARVALAILSVCAPDQLALAIASSDKAMLTRADGVGPKLGQRICSELKDKIGDLALGAALPAEGESDAESRDAVSALINLGYGRSDAFQAVAAARAKSDAANVGELIRLGLKELAP